MPNFHSKDGITLSEGDIVDALVQYPQKFLWFAQNGYFPHYWQFLFHTNSDKHKLCRFRHLVAGRRGGKTLAAAWEMIFYMLHPAAFHKDAHGVDSNKPLTAWIVTKDYPTGLAALLAVREVLEQAGLQQGVEFKENRGNRWFEFENGSFLLFKTADDPESLRGFGLDIMWYDEAAFITNERAWEVSSPSLADKEGLFITTTTPDGKNWFYNTFWSDQALRSAHQGRVEYRSIDSPYFSRGEWERIRAEYHPLQFKQEFMASFDSMAGKELSGDWLHYYDSAELDQYRKPGGGYDLNIFIGVDPAISLADTADRFVITTIGVTKDRHQAYLLDQWAGRIPFAQQIDKINEWFQRYRPNYIGIEKNAYQAALVQQIQRLEGLPPVLPLWTKGKKFERILAMSPLFRIGRVKISKAHQDFINEWVDYDSAKKNPQDDCLDSMEIALRTAGVLLPGSVVLTEEEPDYEKAATTAAMWGDIATQRRKAMASAIFADDHMGDSENW